ncbi:glycosyltransferase family 4 protein [Pseudonocardia sediminis]|uniref:glycosyltransferase family 4 protein n=1 Tax=Pseudonocardia sediminis TaxID=1397368 RepID=UPI001F5F941B|nr:glycosyltransferase family 4 protein [Pseudonocardia sediminis]
MHLHSAAHGSFVRKAILVWLAGAAGARVVLHVHSGHIEEFFESLPRHLQAVLIATLRRADRVIALGETWAERLRTIAPGAQVCVIANPVQLPARTASGGPGPVRVVFLGPMREDKGFFHLLDAWSAMTREPGCPTARLVVAGDGDRHRVVARVAELGITSSVELLPWQDVEAVGELLASAHALVLPSLAEGQPMSVLEAMAHGLCVVASAVGGIPEMLDGGDAGVLVPPDDVGRLGDALIQVVRDPLRRTALGQAARARVERHHDVHVVWQRLDDLYRELLPGSVANGAVPAPGGARR